MPVEFRLRTPQTEKIVGFYRKQTHRLKFLTNKPLLNFECLSNEFLFYIFVLTLGDGSKWTVKWVDEIVNDKVDR